MSGPSPSPNSSEYPPQSEHTEPSVGNPDDISQPIITKSVDAAQSAPLAFRAVRGGVWLLGSSYWVLVFGFAANVFLTRLLTPAIYGEFALAMFFFSLLQLRGKLGLNYAFAQQRVISGESIGTLFTVDVLLGLGGLLLTLAAAPVLLHFGYSTSVVTILVILASLSLVESFTSVFGVVLETGLRFKPLSIITSVAMPLSYVPAFWLARHSFGQYSLIAQAIAMSLLSVGGSATYAVMAQRSVFHLRWRFRLGLASEYIRFGAITGAGSFVYSMVMQVDSFLLGTISGVTALGYYDRAYRIAQWPGLMLNAVLGRAAIFTYSELRDDRERLQRSSTMMLWISANVAVPVALALFFSAPDFVPLLFGIQWLPVVPILRILLVVSVARPIWENLLALFVGMGTPRRFIEVSLLQLIVLLVLGTLMTLTAGASGMAAGVVITLFVGVTVAYILLRRVLTLDPWDAVSGPLFAAVFTFLGYLLLVRIIGSEYPAWLAVLWKAGYAIAGFALFSMLVRPKQYRARAGYILRLFRGRSVSG